MKYLGLKTILLSLRWALSIGKLVSSGTETFSLHFASLVCLVSLRGILISQLLHLLNPSSMSLIFSLYYFS